MLRALKYIATVQDCISGFITDHIAKPIESSNTSSMSEYHRTRCNAMLESLVSQMLAERARITILGIIGCAKNMP